MTSDEGGGKLLARLRAPAKLTLSLEITGRRDGLHLLRAEMVSVDLADDLWLSEPGPAGTAVAVELDPPGPPVAVDAADNLVLRALALCGRAASVRLVKRIPVGGGLGGGSADAGAVLRWAGWRDVPGAVVLGGDVPFCVVGGRALVEGVGERVTPLAYVAREVTLVLCPFPVPTGACYDAFDADGGARSRGGRNDLRGAAETVEPRLRTAADWLAAQFGRPVELCGSGSSLYCEGRVNGSVRQWSMASPVGELRCVLARTVPAAVPWPGTAP